MSRVKPLILLLLFILPGAKANKWNYKGVFVVTRYTAGVESCGKWADGKTATGTRARYGVVAIDPKVIPLGSKVKVEGFKTIFSAEDVGGAIKGKKIDIFHPNLKRCLEFGHQKRKVWVLK